MEGAIEMPKFTQNNGGIYKGVDKGFNAICIALTFDGGTPYGHGTCNNLIDLTHAIDSKTGERILIAIEG